MDIKKLLINSAKQNKKTIVFPEADFSTRIISACEKIAKNNIANIVLIGNEKSLQSKLSQSCFNYSKIVDPANFNQKSMLASDIVEKRKSKGITEDEAYNLLNDPIYFAVAYVDCGLADGIVCGAEVPTANTLRPALQIIKGKTGLVTSCFLMIGNNNVTDSAFLIGDCAVIEQPTSDQLAEIASRLVEFGKTLNLEKPKVAFLSYSTNGSAVSEQTKKVKDAYNIFVENNPQTSCVGEVQFDCAVDKNVARTKMPKSRFQKPANIFVMPNIEAGNICYKVAERFGGLFAVGPITLGFNKPVNDLSRGCKVEDIVLLTAITALQCKK